MILGAAFVVIVLLCKVTIMDLKQLLKTGLFSVWLAVGLAACNMGLPENKVPVSPPATPTNSEAPVGKADELSGGSPLHTGAMEPLAPAACQELQQAMAKELPVEVRQQKVPFQDYISGASGIGCQLLATGTGADFGNFVDVAARLQAVLESHGWTEDMSYMADSSTATATAFRQEDRLCLMAVGWAPAPEANCPEDQPISACHVPPQQQLFVVSLNCARQTEASG